MEKNSKKTVYYNDLLQDDFANNITKPVKINDDFVYIHKNPFFRFFGKLLYFVIAIPILFLIGKIRFHVKVYNKNAIKKLKKTGFFVYINHTQDTLDAYINQAFTFPQRYAHIICSNDVYSLKPLIGIINMLGAFPIPNSLPQSKNFFDAIKYYVDKNHGFVIMPEAHIWPYYNKIRPFLDKGFIFPSIFNKPILVSTVVYRKPKKEGKKPYISLYISDPIYPKENLSAKENQTYLRDECYKIMCETVEKYNSYEYIHYEQKKTYE